MDDDSGVESEWFVQCRVCEGAGEVRIIGTCPLCDGKRGFKANGEELEEQMTDYEAQIRELAESLNSRASPSTTSSWREKLIQRSQLSEQVRKMKARRIKLRIRDIMRDRGTHQLRFARHAEELFDLLEKHRYVAHGEKLEETLLSNYVPLEEVPPEGIDLSSGGSDVLTLRQANGNTYLTMDYEADFEVKVLKYWIADIDGNLLVQRGHVLNFYQLFTDGMVPLADDHTLARADVEPGSEVTLIRRLFCAFCLGECFCETCHRGKVGWSRSGRPYNPSQKACEVCGWCVQCNRDKCRCTLCHGRGNSSRGGCKECGVRYDPCWGGGTRVLLPAGGSKPIREIRVGDLVRTVKGARRVAAIWSGPHDRGRTEVCNFRGVWITSHHPVIVGRRWVFPADVCDSFKLEEQPQLIGDLFNFELEGHDDTMLLKGEASEHIVVTCTLGKFLGHRYGCNVCTRRSTRCAGECRQCDAVYVPGMDFARIPADMRWRYFPAFPQVEWDADAKSEFGYASEVMLNNPPPPRLQDADVVARPALAWRGNILAALSRRVASGNQRLTGDGLARLMAAHVAFPAPPSTCAQPSSASLEAPSLLDVARRAEGDDVEDFGAEETFLLPTSLRGEPGTCGLCLAETEVFRPCTDCDGRCCRACILKHSEATQRANPFALPLLPCLWCGLRVPSTTWQALGVSLEASEAAAKSLFAANCGKCGSRTTHFVEKGDVATSSTKRRTVASNLFADATAALQAWRSYREATVSPKDALARILATLRTSDEASVRRMLSLVLDAERRMGLQLALLSEAPSASQLRCRGCSGSVCCLRCRLASHCGPCPSERPLAARCPSCGAGAHVDYASAAADGTLCSDERAAMVLCVCGKYWEQPIEDSTRYCQPVSCREEYLAAQHLGPRAQRREQDAR